MVARHAIADSRTLIKNLFLRVVEGRKHSARLLQALYLQQQSCVCLHPRSIQARLLNHLYQLGQSSHQARNNHSATDRNTGPTFPSWFTRLFLNRHTLLNLRFLQQFKNQNSRLNHPVEGL